jgi:hypothetical protein
VLDSDPRLGHSPDTVAETGPPAATGRRGPIPELVSKVDAEIAAVMAEEGLPPGKQLAMIAALDLMKCARPTARRDGLKRYCALRGWDAGEPRPEPKSAPLPDGERPSELLSRLRPQKNGRA